MRKLILCFACVAFLVGWDETAERNNEAKKEPQKSPLFLVIDLDSDGIELMPLEKSNVYFDVDGDGLTTPQTPEAMANDNVYLGSVAA